MFPDLWQNFCVKANWLSFLVSVIFPLCIALGQESHPGQILGRVEDPTSAPMVGASLTLLSLERVHQATSTSDGTFQFENLEPGMYDLEITAPGFTKKTVPVTLQSPGFRQTVSVVLNVGSVPDMEKCGRDISIRYEALKPTGANLSGTLRDYFGNKPIPQAQVTLVSAANRQAPVVVRSDRAGRFIVFHLPPDYYEIQMSRQGYEREELKHVAVPRENRVFVESTLRKRKQIAICQ